MGRDDLAWHGGPPPPEPTEGVVGSVGLNAHRPKQAIDPDAPGGAAPIAREGDVRRGATALDDGVQVEVRRLGDDGPTTVRPSGRVRLTRQG